MIKMWKEIICVAVTLLAVDNLRKLFSSSFLLFCLVCFPFFVGRQAVMFICSEKVVIAVRTCDCNYMNVNIHIYIIASISITFVHINIDFDIFAANVFMYLRRCVGWREGKI